MHVCIKKILYGFSFKETFLVPFRIEHMQGHSSSVSVNLQKASLIKAFKKKTIKSKIISCLKMITLLFSHTSRDRFCCKLAVQPSCVSGLRKSQCSTGFTHNIFFISTGTQNLILSSHAEH